MVDPYEIIGYDVISRENGQILARGVDENSAHHIADAQNGHVIPIMRMFAHRAAYTIHRSE